MGREGLGLGIRQIETKQRLYRVFKIEKCHEKNHDQFSRSTRNKNKSLGLFVCLFFFGGERFSSYFNF